MIILVSGTNGAGKTHLVRKVLEQLGPVDESLMGGPRNTTLLGTRHGPVTVLGRYDGPTCGGCDCYSWKGAADDLEKLILSEVEDGQTVLLEGVIVSTWGKERMLRLREHGLRVIHLATPLEECLDSVNARRKARAESRGKEFKPVARDNIVSKHVGLAKGVRDKQRLRIPVEVLSRDEALAHVLSLCV